MQKYYKLAITAVVVGFGLGTLSTAQAATLSVSASDQGSWAAEGGFIGGNSNDNTNYITGNIRATDLRDYFTFNLDNVAQVSSATLQIQRFVGSESGVKTLGFFDVSTPNDVLSQKKNSPNDTIYNDLGSGKNYGTFNVSSSGDSNEILNFALNSDAIADINARSGKFFSIGGALLSNIELSDDYLFSESGDGTLAKLVLNVDSATVPEPDIFVGVVVAGVAGLWLKRK
ncbi:MAG: hypothetical protein PUP90_19800 [Nostoc sp. S4]|nr:hypothetical protein [Nostoc sp. S4]